MDPPPPVPSLRSAFGLPCVPHGVVGGSKVRKTEVWAENIDGIICYLDETGAVYKTEDVMNKKMNPQVIGQWTLAEGKYAITMTI